MKRQSTSAAALCALAWVVEFDPATLERARIDVQIQLASEHPRPQ